ncbi:MAG: hypothetical protein LBL55_11095 [Propionibacteriaceae bacterium]|jgi:hypothetical protein|nr:hypothetical protein [Propionibacteriaceae bacterium]
MSFDAQTNTITLTRSDDKRILLILDGPPWGAGFTGLLSGTLTARNAQAVWGSDQVTLIKKDTVAVDLTHWQTAQPAGSYQADIELILAGGPDGPPGDPHSGETVWTIWQGTIVLWDDQTKETP